MMLHNKAPHSSAPLLAEPLEKTSRPQATTKDTRQRTQEKMRRKPRVLSRGNDNSRTLCLTKPNDRDTKGSRVECEIRILHNLVRHPLPRLDKTRRIVKSADKQIQRGYLPKMPWNKTDGRPMHPPREALWRTPLCEQRRNKRPKFAVNVVPFPLRMATVTTKRLQEQIHLAFPATE